MYSNLSNILEQEIKRTSIPLEIIIQPKKAPSHSTWYYTNLETILKF